MNMNEILHIVFTPSYVVHFYFIFSYMHSYEDNLGKTTIIRYILLLIYNNKYILYKQLKLNSILTSGKPNPHHQTNQTNNSDHQQKVFTIKYISYKKPAK